MTRHLVGGPYGGERVIEPRGPLVGSEEQKGLTMPLADQLANNRARAKRATRRNVLQMLMMRRYTYFGSLQWRIEEARRIAAALHGQVP